MHAFVIVAARRARLYYELQKVYSKLFLPVEIHTRVVVAVRAPIHSYLVGAPAGMLGDTSDTGHRSDNMSGVEESANSRHPEFE